MSSRTMLQADEGRAMPAATAPAPSPACTARLADTGDPFGFVYCDQPGEPMPQIGAGHALCESHRNDERIVVRDYRGATIVEVVSECSPCRGHEPSARCRAWRGVRYHVDRNGSVGWSDGWEVLYGAGVASGYFAEKCHGPATYNHSELFVVNGSVR